MVFCGQSNEKSQHRMGRASSEAQEGGAKLGMILRTYTSAEMFSHVFNMAEPGWPLFFFPQTWPISIHPSLGLELLQDFSGSPHCLVTMRSADELGQQIPGKFPGSIHDYFPSTSVLRRPEYTFRFSSLFSGQVRVGTMSTWIAWSLAGAPSQLATYRLYAAKSLQSCPTLCDPIDGGSPGSPVPGILQARTLEWVAISFSNAWKWKVKVKLLSRVWLLATP